MKGRCLNRLTMGPNTVIFYSLYNKMSSIFFIKGNTMNLLRKFKYAIFLTLYFALLVPTKKNMCLQNCLPNLKINSLSFWLNPRPISNHQLNTLLYLHLGPIYLVVFKGSYCFHMRYPILRGASRLDAFSVYPVPT